MSAQPSHHYNRTPWGAEVCAPPSCPLPRMVSRPVLRTCAASAAACVTSAAASPAFAFCLLTLASRADCAKAFTCMCVQHAQNEHMAAASKWPGAQAHVRMPMQTRHANAVAPAHAARFA